MTITLAAVFAPLAFTGGLTGALFREFAVTLAGAVVISGLVALTITPMMSARILKARRAQPFPAPSSTAPSSASSGATSGWCRGSLNYRPVTLMIVVALVAVTGFMFTKTSERAGAGRGCRRALRRW